jgi:hypothetical protein
VRATDCAVKARAVVESQCTWKTDNTFRFWCQLVIEVRTEMTGSSDRRLGFARVEISMESLILAQDERWRRA